MILLIEGVNIAQSKILILMVNTAQNVLILNFITSQLIHVCLAQKVIFMIKTK